MLHSFKRRSTGFQSLQVRRQLFHDRWVNTWTTECCGGLEGHAKPLNVLIYGAGAVGAVVAWRLNQMPNLRISVVCRSNYEAVKAHGFHMSTLSWGQGHFKPYTVYRSCTEAYNSSFDYVLCANKMTAGDENPYQGLKAVVNERTTLVSLQNGVNVERPLRLAFPNNTLISGIVYFSCQQPKPGFVSQESSIRPYPLGVAVYDRRHAEFGTLDDANLAEFVRFGRGEFQPLEDPVSERWGKQLWNGVFNPLCAISGLNTHDLLRQSDSSRNIVAKVMDEIYSVAVAAGADIDPALLQKLIDVTERSPPITPSMLQDVRANRAIEMESLCGSVWRLGMRLGLNVPMLEEVYSKLAQIQGNRR